MKRIWPLIPTVVLLFAALLLMTGCPKRPAPAADAGPGSPTGPSSAGAAGSGPGGAGGVGAAAETAPGAIGTGPGSAAGSPSTGPGGAGAGMGVAGATGTAIPVLPSPKEFVEISALSNVHFDFDRYEIRSPDKAILDENAKWLKANPTAFLLIEGHCDERGTNEYNLALGERRAKATRDYLISDGIDGARITVISYGEERPLCTERTEACWAKNRRAHFLVKP
jgi:peptidoglycan-associated lipoprotein